jgi:hypothetical protein
MQTRSVRIYRAGRLRCPTKEKVVTVPRDFAEIMPARIARSERDPRGYPIPWFVHRPANGAIDFRVTDPKRFAQAVKQHRYWVCGEPLGKFLAFVGGPLSAAQRLFADPPAHVDCAEFSARVCPFLAIPTAQRREANKPLHMEMPGQHVTANHEVTGILITTDYSVLPQGMLVASEPREIRWFHEGRPATRSEVQHAIDVAHERGEVKLHPQASTILRKLATPPLPD